MRKMILCLTLLAPMTSLAAPPTHDSFLLLLASNQQWDNMTEAERNAVRRQREAYEAMPRSEQERIRNARERYQSLPESQREQLRQRWKQLPAKEKEKYKIKNNKKQ